MKIYSKLISLTILTSLIGSQFAFAQEYRVLPPITDMEEKNVKPILSDPPSINNGNSLGDIPNVTVSPINNALRGQISVIPTGTSFQVITNSTINSLSNQVGEIFTATLAEPVTLDGNVVIPEGSEAIGQITYIEKAGRVGKNAVMEVKFTSIKLPYGQKIPMTGKIVTVDQTGILKGGSLKKQIASTVASGAVSTAGGTLAGLSLGSLMGSAGGGALFGTTVGGFLGLGYIVARKGKEVVIPNGTKMNILLERSLTIGR